MDVTEKFGQLNLNQPLSNEEEEKAQAAIDSILGGFEHRPPQPVAEVDTSKLYDFAGMETNQSTTINAQLQPNVATEAQSAQNNNAGLDIFGDM